MTHSDAAHRVARYYEGLARAACLAGRPWPEQDRIIWLVVSTRCEIDMSGFSAVFDQLLHLDDVLFLADALKALGETELAHAFTGVHKILAELDFDNTIMQTADLPEHIQQRLDRIGAGVTEHGGLWRLDGRLSELIPKD